MEEYTDNLAAWCGLFLAVVISLLVLSIINRMPEFLKVMKHPLVSKFWLNNICRIRNTRIVTAGRAKSARTRTRTILKKKLDTINSHRETQKLVCSFQ